MESRQTPAQLPDERPPGDESVDVGALFEAHASFLLAVVRRLCASEAQAQDVVQETFIVAHRRRAEIGGIENQRGWLYGVAKNLVRHRWRSSSRRQNFEDKLAEHQNTILPSEAPSAERGVEAKESAERVWACLDGLPDEQREVFVLYELQELAGKEVAELLSVSANTVWSRLHRARAGFRKRWLELEGGGEPS